jgi:hypothetical protein
MVTQQFGCEFWIEHLFLILTLHDKEKNGGMSILFVWQHLKVEQRGFL